MTRGHTHTHTHTHTHSKTALEEGSARRRDFYWIAHNSQKTETSIPSYGFKPVIPENECPPATPYIAWQPGSAVYEIQRGKSH